MRTCKFCEVEFDENSIEKRRVGGLINVCPDCVEESGGDQSPPKYLAVAAGNGKMSDITILSFDDEVSREKYRKAFRSNSGQDRAKVCQMGRSNATMSGLKFKIVGENIANDNHKGKA